MLTTDTFLCGICKSVCEDEWVLRVLAPAWQEECIVGAGAAWIGAVGATHLGEPGQAVGDLQHELKLLLDAKGGDMAAEAPTVGGTAILGAGEG